ncbi:hypothetical protein BJ508DRAFT_337120 [Ascobolus immersus RN42]|uniref:Uncharacterized protein n=1 Tax=Ascobolus immersus RN42 TaxID=1160509 RepID=A0A3N4HE98_ASCIM|nr:hypothetical protein BJ508DRAFT_337120 [Ascobolus immersus RN42]
MASKGPNRLEVLMDDDTERCRKEEQARRHKHLQQAQAQKRRLPVDVAEEEDDEFALPSLTGVAGLPKGRDELATRGGSESPTTPLHSSVPSRHPPLSYSALVGTIQRGVTPLDDHYNPLAAFPSTIEQLDRLDKTFGKSSTCDALRRKIEMRQSAVAAKPAKAPSSSATLLPRSVPQTAGKGRSDAVPRRPSWKSVLPHIIREPGDEKRVAAWLID